MTICIVSRFKNERHILYEWINHHLQEGIDKILLIDDNSNDNYYNENSWMKELINNNVIEIYNSVNEQTLDYDIHLKVIKNYEWVIQIDMDEFIYCPNQEINLKQVLYSSYLQNIDYIRINWKIFIHTCTNQPKSIIEDNIIAQNDNKDPLSTKNGGIKCIGRTRNLKSINIHEMKFDKKIINKINLDAYNRIIHINHYRTQSNEYLFGVKEQRGGGIHKNKYKSKNMSQIDTYKHYCNKSYYNKTETTLKKKREDLINKINEREQIKPYIYSNSSWLINKLSI
tara:strand:- start:1519 stop:2370 length:852 start_codon:yes stop_codon:yes gene_type:complete